MARIYAKQPGADLLIGRPGGATNTGPLGRATHDKPLVVNDDIAEALIEEWKGLPPSKENPNGRDGVDLFTVVFDPEPAAPAKSATTTTTAKRRGGRPRKGA